MFATIAERAWFAWHCLPRNRRNKPPAIRKLELAHGLANAALRKVIYGQTARPAYDSVLKMAAALNCSPQWLVANEGPGPLASTFVEPPPARRGSVVARGLSARDLALFEGKADQLGKRASVRPRKLAYK